jgi:hypothetical protein
LSSTISIAQKTTIKNQLYFEDELKFMISDENIKVFTNNFTLEPLSFNFFMRPQFYSTFSFIKNKKNLKYKML